MGRGPHRRCRRVLPADEPERGATYFLYKAHRRELIDPKIAEYGARFVKSTGGRHIGRIRDCPRRGAVCEIAVQERMVERCKGESVDSPYRLSHGS
jgi:hypothetical protein